MPTVGFVTSIIYPKHVPASLRDGDANRLMTSGSYSSNHPPPNLRSSMESEMVTILQRIGDEGLCANISQPSIVLLGVWRILA